MLAPMPRPAIFRAPTSGGGGLTVTSISGSVAASTTEDIDTIVLSGLCSVKYNLCVYNSTEDKWCSFELQGGRMSGSAVEDTVYGKVGDILDFNVEFTVVGSDAKLRITNNETFTLTVDGYKI